mmetsp:Transcript_13855/g.52727  ORF Transcript_13855/g.52727 Transcript_13855/m.52727 type:complete len:263 (-) Transcript_13855:922-1710(-)
MAESPFFGGSRPKDDAADPPLVELDDIGDCLPLAARRSRDRALSAGSAARPDTAPTGVPGGEAACPPPSRQGPWRLLDGQVPTPRGRTGTPAPSALWCGPLRRPAEGPAGRIGPLPASAARAIGDTELANGDESPEAAASAPPGIAAMAASGVMGAPPMSVTRKARNSSTCLGFRRLRLRNRLEDPAAGVPSPALDATLPVVLSRDDAPPFALPATASAMVIRPELGDAEPEPAASPAPAASPPAEPDAVPAGRSSSRDPSC